MDARTPRGAVLWTVARMTLSSLGLLGVYFAAPLTRSFTTVTFVALTGALVVLGVLVAWQARAIVRSPSPRLRTAEALGTSIPLFVVVFAASYCLMGNATPDAFTEPLTHIDALYFTITVFSSVGFGDIAPRSQAARALTTVQMLGDLVILGVAVKVLFEAMRRGVERHQDG
ncbi:potassium channel protein [Actinomadura darangshiensis]|uniref:Potassium channel protein n=1 Tax=Actinomadura darangshiensis TaxID=705336 RepID=A0A4R5BPS5_9ACTN|nr:potassium channel family protein [Actinomadura darangshiensis]TDD88908.1 potassium channel protein [Actinomadura darangshiensis]